jgi:hypothetical protein
MSEELDFSSVTSEDDLSGYDSIPNGQYHLVCNAADDSRERRDGIWIEWQVRAGNVKKQQGKTFRETFYDGSPDHKDGGEFCENRKKRLALAAGLAGPAVFGKRASVEWSDLVGRQIVAAVVNNETEKGTFSQTDGLKLFSPTDPKVSEVPKDEEALALITSGSGGDGQQQAAATPASAPVATGEVDYDQI